MEFEPAIEHAVAALGSPDRDALEIAKVILERAPVRAWPALWARPTQDDELARAVFLYAARHFSLATPFYAGIGEEAIADLYLLMERLFPSKDDERGPSGFVSPLEAIPYLRDGAPRLLVSMGTEAAVRALRRLVTAHPDLPILPFELSRAELAMRLKTWSPLTTREMFALTDRPDTRLVTSTDDLLAILIEILDQFAAELQAPRRPCVICGTGKELRSYTDPSTKMGFPMSSPASCASIFLARGFSPTGRSRSCATRARPSGRGRIS